MHFLDELINVLRADQRFIGERNQIIKTKVSDAARDNDRLLLKALLRNDLLRDGFFTKMDDIYVFDKNKFVWVLESKDFLPDSYTMYKNKIGLVDDHYNLINQKQDVSLVWPYKDCILEGGQTKEDQKRDEVFFNETLAPDQVNRLLAPKVFGKAKRFTSNGVEEDIEFNDEDNLIIKGNNLLVLVSLLKRYEGQVDFIYLDPPYYFNKTKQVDSFLYNSNFKLSTWLTFMKNRLEIARKLLSKTGVIFVSMGEDGQAYLKLLMDDIFGIDNFVQTFVWRNTDNADTLSKKTRSGLEYIHAFENNKDGRREWVGNLSMNDDAPLLNSSNNIGELTFPSGSIRFNIQDGIYSAGDYHKVKLMNDLIVKNSINENDIKIEGRFKWGQNFLNDEISGGTYFLIKTNQFSIRYQRDKASTMPLEKMIDLDYLSKTYGVGTNEDSSSHLKSLGIKFGYAKPESLVGFLIKSVTKEKDLVLDFFMGSGTTQSAALKLNRRFIGVEQLDYIKTASTQRLKKVINGEQGGISKDVNWQGGGSFVYCELLEDNQAYIKKLEEASSSEQIKEILLIATKNGKIVPSVLPSDLRDSSEAFDKLSIEEQRNLVLELMDKNKLYVNLSDLEDESYGVSESDKKFTRSFYKREMVKIR